MAPLTPRDKNVQAARRDSLLGSPATGKKRSIDQVDLTKDNDSSPKPTKQQKKTAARDTKKSDKKDGKKKDYDVSDIHLDGEETDSCKIYDTCQDIRNKINAELRKGTAKAEIARHVSAQFSTPKKVSGSQLQSFLDKKGPLGGAESGAFYGGFVFFEKLRLKQGKEESKKRFQVREAHPGGVPQKDSNKTFVTCVAGTRPYIDNLGRFSIH
ncbi:Hypothetical protein D9617_5g069180 [Elsinoe fawcettii]|nr:Hypothetical protein D9617_5g069180 [Elsinoe fawcettii]